MNIISTEIPSRWLEGATLNWVWNNADEKSDGGASVVVPRQTRPLQQWSFDVFQDDVVAVENLAILCNGSANGFFARPPIDRYYKVVGRALGVATGSLQTFQLTIIRGQTWNALYVDSTKTTVYGNGVALSGGAWSITDGVLSVTGTVGQTLTIDFQYKTPFKFVGDSLSIEASATFETPRNVTIEEIP